MPKSRKGNTVFVLQKMENEDAMPSTHNNKTIQYSRMLTQQHCIAHVIFARMT